MPFFGVPIRNGVPIGLGSIVGFGVQQFDPSELFVGGTAGAWYDPSDLTTLFTTSAGTTQCAMPGQGSAVSVGAMLDKRATGYSVFFDGTGDYLTAGTTSTFNFMHNASALFTFECWVYRTVANVLQILFSTDGTALANTGCSVYITSGNRIEFVISRGVSGTFVCFATSVATVPANQWSHIALTYDQSLTSDNVKFYINGALDAQGTKTASAPSGGNSATAGIIGALSSGVFPISGYISNLRIVNAVLPISTPTAPLSPISGTSLLTCGVTWSGNPTITKNGDARIDGLNPFTASPVGNHAIAFNDTTARPELRARVNLLERSEEFGNAYWSRDGVTISANTTATTDPLGGNTADKITEESTSAAHVVYTTSAISASAIQYTLSVYVKAAERTFARLDFVTVGYTAGAAVILNLSTLATTITNYGATSGTTATVTTVGNGWYRLAVTLTATAASYFAQIGPAISGTPANYTGDGTSGIYIWGADLRPANIGANVPAYQRIADANTYDTSGFPLYLRFDGIDDSMYTPANLNLSGTDKVAVFAGVRKNADVSIIAEFSASAGANNGAFLLATGGWGAENGTYVRQSRGTATAFAQPAANSYPSPRTDVLTGTSDIAGDSVVLRVNGTQVATSATDQGSGNYGTHPLYIGARNNGSLWFNGHLHSLIIAGSAVSAGNISATESWVAGRTGIAI